MQRVISDGLGDLSTRRVRVGEFLRKSAMDGGFSAIESTDVDGTAKAHEVGEKFGELG